MARITPRPRVAAKWIFCEYQMVLYTLCTNENCERCLVRQRKEAAKSLRLYNTLLIHKLTLRGRHLTISHSCHPVVGSVWEPKGALPAKKELPNR